MVRAVLFAIATVATRAGFRASRLANRGSIFSGLDFARLTSEVMPTMSSLRRYLSPILVQLGKERQHLRPSQRLADNDLTARINAVNLKNALGQIQTNRSNLHDGWLLARECLTAFTPWHLDAVSGSHPPHLLSAKRKSDLRAVKSAFDPDIH